MEAELFLRSYLLVLSRTASMLALSPPFNAKILPTSIRIAIIITLAFILTAFLYKKMQIPDNIVEFALRLVLECLIGCTLGLFIQLFVYTLQTAVEFINTQLGFEFARLIDPMAQIEQPILGQLFSYFALLVFIQMDGPQQLINILSISFLRFPVAYTDICKIFIELFQYSFIVAFKLSLPMVSILFLVTLALGLLMRAAPMLNIFAVGWDITILVGLGVLVLSLPILYKTIYSGFEFILLQMKELFG